MVRRPATLSLTLALAALLAAGPLSVYARTQQVEGSGGTGTDTTNANRTFTTNTDTSNANVGNTNATNTNASNSNVSTNTNRGLEAAQLRACQNREAAITRIQERIARRAARHLEVFGSIADRVEAFYVRKGYSVADYNQLVGEVNAKKAAVQTQLEALKLRVSFSCSDNDPHGMTRAFQEQRSDTIAALKNLQTAVRNLTIAVKSAVDQGNANGNTNGSNAND